MTKKQNLVNQLKKLREHAMRNSLLDAAEFLSSAIDERDIETTVTVRHEHYFNHPDSEIDGRFDAIENSIGEFYVLDVKNKERYACKTWREANKKAEKMAQDWCGKVK